jgi:hypothetical protein
LDFYRSGAKWAKFGNFGAFRSFKFEFSDKICPNFKFSKKNLQNSPNSVDFVW